MGLEVPFYASLHLDARVLSSPSGGAAEDNVEERENSEVTQFLVTGYVLRTDGRMDRET